MAPWVVKLNPQVEATIDGEERQVLDLYTSNPKKPGVHPGLVAHRDLKRQLAGLSESPNKFSYVDKKCGDEVRFSDCAGWRLILTIDYDQRIIQAHYLARIKDFHTTSPRKTFEEWKNQTSTA